MSLEISEYVSVEMIRYLEGEGWIVVWRDEYDKNPFDDNDIRLMASIIDGLGCTVGSDIYNLREKISQTLRNSIR